MNQKNSLLLVAVASILATGADVEAQSYVYSQTIFPTNNAAYGPGEGYSQLGGKIREINSTYNKTSQTLTWSATLDTHYQSTSTDPRLSNAFFLVLSNGPDPKATANDEYVIVLFDGTNAGSPAVTFYSYDGGGIASFVPGVNNIYLGGTNAPGGSSAVVSSSVSTSSLGLDGSGRAVDRRTFDLTLDTSDLNDATWAGTQFANAGAAFNPANWYGIGFGDDASPNDEKIGLWFHPSELNSVSYARDGRVTGIVKTPPGDHNGYLDLGNRDAKLIPEPSSSSLLALAGLAAVLRRRR